jgi:hypothetical protein
MLALTVFPAASVLERHMFFLRQPAYTSPEACACAGRLRKSRLREKGDIAGSPDAPGFGTRRIMPCPLASVDAQCVDDVREERLPTYS